LPIVHQEEVIIICWLWKNRDACMVKALFGTATDGMVEN